MLKTSKMNFLKLLMYGAFMMSCASLQAQTTINLPKDSTTRPGSTAIVNTFRENINTLKAEMITMNTSLITANQRIADLEYSDGIPVEGGQCQSIGNIAADASGVLFVCKKSGV